MTKYQISTLEKLLHTLCENRDGARCVKCGRGGSLQLSHVKSKGAWPRIRFEPLNVKLLCWRCHLGNGGWHQDPTTNVAWFSSKFSSRAKYLDKLTRNYYTLDKPDYKWEKEFLTNEITKLRNNR